MNERVKGGEISTQGSKTNLPILPGPQGDAVDACSAQSGESPRSSIPGRGY